MMKIIEVNTYFIRENNFIIISLRIGQCGEQLLLIAVFKRSRASDAWTKTKHISIIALKLVCISRYIGPRPDKTHIADKYIP